MSNILYNKEYNYHQIFNWTKDVNKPLNISPEYLHYFVKGKVLKLHFDKGKQLVYYFKSNGGKRYIIEDIFQIKFADFTINYNSTPFDYISGNFILNNKTEEKYKKQLQKKGYVIKKYLGHTIKTTGRTAYRVKNPKWLVYDKSSNKDYGIMYCEPNLYVKFDIEDLPKITKIGDKTPTWHGTTDPKQMKTTSYYIMTHTDLQYLHQYLKNWKGKGKGQESVNHINGDTLDNRQCNLEITTQSHQNRDRPDVKNKNCPDDVKKYMNKTYGILNLPRHIQYRYEPKYNKEYFLIEKHPNLKKRAVTSEKGISKSTNIINKFEEIIDMYRTLEGGKLYFEAEGYTEEQTPYDNLPENCSKTKHCGKDKLKYDNRDKTDRKTVTHTINEKISADENIKQFLLKIKTKYDIELFTKEDTSSEDKIEKLNHLIKDIEYVTTVNKGKNNFGLYYETPTGYKKYLAYDNETPIEEFYEAFCKSINKWKQKSVKLKIKK